MVNSNMQKQVASWMAESHMWKKNKKILKTYLEKLGNPLIRMIWTYIKYIMP